MSVNNSVSEQQEDVADTGLYIRELMRMRGDLPYPDPDQDSGDGGLYKDWKARNGMDNSSEKMISSLGRTLHNQGIIPQTDNDFYDSSNHHSNINTREYRGNEQQSPEYHLRVQHNVRLHSSEPCYSPQQYRVKPNANEVAYRKDERSCRVEMNGQYHQNGRHYSYPGRNNGEMDCALDEPYNNEMCKGQCCRDTKQSIKSPTNPPPNCQGSLQRMREPVNLVKGINHRNPQQFDNCGSPRYHNIDSNQRHNDETDRSLSYPVSQPCHPQHNQSNPPCYRPPPPCNCCQNTVEPPRQSTSPHKKCTPNRKTEASIKKLYRILWLQNEQLGLLEKQVSKLIELNFSKEASERSGEKSISEDKSTTVSESVRPIKPKNTCDIGVMTDLPCHNCVMKERKFTSSESEPEITKTLPVENSLTLHGVDIAVNGEGMSSPPVSMHIDMQEFQESSFSETNESDTTEDESEPVGWTFYDNVVGQVNNILKSANKKKMKKKRGYNDEDLRAMAVEQLKRLAIAAPESDTNMAKRVTFEQGLKEQQINLRAQSEISMNFNALASKYLTTAGGKVQDISLCNVVSGNTNMSLATMRYLERHQIANRDVMDVHTKKAIGTKTRKSRTNGEKAVTSKFLDITAIRQQPKLLPKDT